MIKLTKHKEVLRWLWLITVWVQGKKAMWIWAEFPEFTDIITSDPHLTEILSSLPIYAESDLPILLTGEPGTGKELVAMALLRPGAIPAPDLPAPQLRLPDGVSGHERAVRARPGGLYRGRPRPAG